MLFALSAFLHSPCASSFQPTELVNKVCTQTSNYTFCVESLYSDPHTPQADRYELAYVAFRLASFNASSTKGHIAKLLKNATAGQSQRLRRCARDYDKAIWALNEAFGDLDSETFYMLVGLSKDAAHAVADCRATLKGSSVTLTAMNKVFKALCEICVAVSKLF